MNDQSSKESEKSFKESEVVVILEDIKGKFDLLAEGQKDIRREIDNLHKKVDDNAIELRKEMKAGFKEMHSRFDQVFEYLSNVEDELMEVKNDLKALKEKPDKEEFIKLEKRVATLEKKLEMYKLKAA